jgi:two-component system nitrate/nitrite response regulator NarL
VIVDDSDDFLTLATALLAGDGLDVVGTASSAAEGLVCVGELRPDVALVDINLGADSGFDLADDLASTDTVIILISAHAEVDMAALIDASPALGFIRKTELSADAVHALVGGDGAGRAAG